MLQKCFMCDGTGEVVTRIGNTFCDFCGGRKVLGPPDTLPEDEETQHISLLQNTRGSKRGQRYVV